MGSGTKDYTAVPDNTVDIIKYLTYLSSISKEQATNIMEQVNKTSKDNVQGTQNGNKTVPPTGQTIDKPTENKPAVGGNSENTNEGGTK